MDCEMSAVRVQTHSYHGGRHKLLGCSESVKGLAENEASNTPQMIEEDISVSRVPQAWKRCGVINSDTSEDCLFHSQHHPVKPLQSTDYSHANTSGALDQVGPSYDSGLDSVPDNNSEFEVVSTSGAVLGIGSNRECALRVVSNGDCESSNRAPETEDVLSSDPESKELVDNVKHDSQINHQHTESNYLNEIHTLGTLNSTYKNSGREPETNLDRGYCKNFSNSEGSLEERGDTLKNSTYLESYRSSADTMYIHHSYDDRQSLFERSSNLYRNDTFASALDMDFGYCHNQLGIAYYKSNYRPSRSKYRLCFTSDLSESSSEEEEQDMHGRSNLPMEENVAGRSDVGSSMFETDLDTLQKVNDVPLSTTWLNLPPLADALTYSENFEDIDYDIPSSSSVSRNNLPDSLDIAKFDNSHAGRDTAFNHKGTHLHQSSVDGGSRLQAMSTVNLGKLYKLLKTRMEDISQVLVDLLVQREMLVSENVLLHQNIAQLTRTTQSLYRRQSQKTLLRHHTFSKAWRPSSSL